jgi:hypothetical protein
VCNQNSYPDNNAACDHNYPHNNAVCNHNYPDNNAPGCSYGECIRTCVFNVQKAKVILRPHEAEFVFDKGDLPNEAEFVFDKGNRPNEAEVVFDKGEKRHEDASGDLCNPCTSAKLG